ncbi:MAG: hypothetical protein R3250_06510 [Melioribacteraceae bacterium]|nr:hypothetical protein [Melioribacteraceae bacterium]
MKNKLLFIIFFSILSAPHLWGQEKTGLTKEEFAALFEKLTVERENLKNEEENLKLNIDSLKIKLTELDNYYNSCRRTKLVKKFGRDIANRILKGQVWKGMTESMLGESWGKPDRIDTNKEKWGVFSQWYYGNITYFFRDGSMIDWEEEK